MTYYLKTHPDGSEEVFFKYLWELIERQLKVLLGKDIYHKDHVRNELEIQQLRKFTGVLIHYDQWNFYKSNEAVVAQQELEIHAFKQEIIQQKNVANFIYSKL